MVELLVVVSIIGLLLSLLLPTVSLVRSRARGVRCMVNMRTVVFDFRLFADDFGHSTRGDSDGRDDERFAFEDFVESQYKIDEFWSGHQGEQQAMSASREALMCPAGRGALTRVADKPCTRGAVTPYQNVSYGFNARLHRQATLFRGRIILVPALPDSGILENPHVPVVFDIDGRLAVEKNKQPYFSAPPGPIQDPYHNGDYWFPSQRHNEHTNVGFTGGHVLSSENPTQERGWDWDYQPVPFRPE